MDWIDLIALDELPERRPLGLQAGGVSLVLIRRGDEVVALGDRCPHLGAPLHDGMLDDSGRLVCRAHGWRFDVFAMPENGELPGGCIPIPLRVRHGRIEVRPT